ncbi:MAG TPA: hypothetical protein DCS17_01440 [Flavobacterium sp.]|nr:hypothetical protein [Flavobacterium sp.]
MKAKPKAKLKRPVKRKKHVARLLIVKHGNSLSSQLQKITGDTWNLVDYDSFEKSDVIRHKKSDKWFVVLSQTYYDNLNREALADLFSYYRFAYNFQSIRIK